ncbi:hypothetical protein CCMSSC00406_0009316 [Pleurotus cornucopiae]|uniref:Uncharacterized protein n=1 Tax=Pleurotus cornucopiae TaxID=5321 RepID=A0ACB7J561_PLECO|nr:hypothetical protein CCMSSC00406_0009316 [Pleurotus cornucopiae]
MKREGTLKKNEGGRKERKGSGVDGGAVENVESSTIDDDGGGAWTRGRTGNGEWETRREGTASPYGEHKPHGPTQTQTPTMKTANSNPKLEQTQTQNGK